MLHLGNPKDPARPQTWREYFEEFECIDIDDKKSVEAWWLEQVGDPEEDPITIEPE